MERRITGTTKLLGLIGSPVSHSMSPAMYNHSFEKLGVDYAYLAFDISEEQVPEALESMKLFHMRGMNVTMPCKVAAAQNVDQLSPAARLIGAVNTIVNDDGILIGYNTDGVGYVYNLKEHGVDIKGKKMTILGAGGAATSIQVQCALSGIKEISIFNPKDAFFENAIKTADRIKKEVPGCTISVFDLNDKKKLYEEIANSDILTNATRVGMHPNENESIIQDISIFRKELIVSDIVYMPEITKLLKDAANAGCKTVGGKGMLLWQGAEACKLYTGQDMPVEEVRALYFL